MIRIHKSYFLQMLRMKLRKFSNFKNHSYVNISKYFYALSNSQTNKNIFVGRTPTVSLFSVVLLAES